MKHRSLFIVAAVLLGCLFESKDTTGTVDDTHTGVAMILNPDQTPAEDALVKIFEVNDTSRTPEKQTATNAEGRFSFQGLAKGSYNVMAEKGDLVAFQDSVVVSEDTVFFEPETLGEPGTVRGFVGLQPQHDPRTVTVQALGTDKYSNVDGDGLFTLADMAEGEYILRLVTTLPNYTPTFEALVIDADAPDTLADTLWLIYTGIPVVQGLEAAYDTITGAVRLVWEETEYGNLQDYVIYRDPLDANEFSGEIHGTADGPPWLDTIYRTGSEGSARDFKYRVAVRNNSQEIGETYGFAEMETVPPGRFLMPLRPAEDSVIRDTDSPELVWQSIPGAVAYEVQVASGSNGDVVGTVTEGNVAADSAGNFADPMASSTTQDTTFATQPLGAGVYFWRFRAQNRDSVWGPFSIPTRFSLAGPEPPNLVETADRSVSSAESPVVLTWLSTPHAEGYQVQVTGNSTFDSPATSESTGDTAFSLDLGFGVYRWRVRAMGPVDTGSWSETGTIGVDVFTRIYSEKEHSTQRILQTPEGDYVVAGNEGGALHIARLDPFGYLKWEYTRANTSIYVFLETSDGGFIAAGLSREDSPNDKPIFLKVDGEGREQWTRKAEGIERNFAFGQVTPDGGIILATYNGEDSTSIVLKTDSEGTTVWSKTYPGEVVGIDTLPEGLYSLGLITRQNELMGEILTLNSMGDTILGKILAGIRSSDLLNFRYFIWMTHTPDGGTIWYDAHFGDLIKFNSQGQREWIYNFGFPPDTILIAGPPNPTPNGHLLFSGRGVPPRYGESIWLVEFDLMGEKKFAANINFSGTPINAIPTPDGGYVFAAQSEAGAVIVKTDPQGNYLPLPDP